MAPEIAGAFSKAVGWDPREVGPGWVFYRLRPARIQAYRGYAEQEGRDMVQRADPLARRALFQLVLDVPEVPCEQPDEGEAAFGLPRVRIALPSKPRHRRRPSRSVLRFICRSDWARRV